MLTWTDPKLQVRPVLEAILQHPDLYQGPSMTLPPVVYTAGLLRRIGRGIDTTSWVGLDAAAGQQLFYPPNVSGWGNRWLDTATFLARWSIAATALKPFQLDPSKTTAPADPDTLIGQALAFFNSPRLRPETDAALRRFAKGTLADAGTDANRGKVYPVLTQNVLRQLIAVSPEFHAA